MKHNMKAGMMEEEMKANMMEEGEDSKEEGMEGEMDKGPGAGYDAESMGYAPFADMTKKIEGMLKGMGAKKMGEGEFDFGDPMKAKDARNVLMNASKAYAKAYGFTQKGGTLYIKAMNLPKRGERAKKAMGMKEKMA